MPADHQKPDTAAERRLLAVRLFGRRVCFDHFRGTVEDDPLRRYRGVQHFLRQFRHFFGLPFRLRDVHLQDREALHIRHERSLHQPVFSEDACLGLTPGKMRVRIEGAEPFRKFIGNDETDPLRRIDDFSSCRGFLRTVFLTASFLRTACPGLRRLIVHAGFRALRCFSGSGTARRTACRALSGRTAGAEECHAQNHNECDRCLLSSCLHDLLFRFLSSV